MTLLLIVLAIVAFVAFIGFVVGLIVLVGYAEMMPYWEQQHRLKHQSKPRYPQPPVSSSIDQDGVIHSG